MRLKEGAPQSNISSKVSLREREREREREKEGCGTLCAVVNQQWA